MIVRYRVTVAPVDGEPVAIEHFETRTDSDAYWRQLQEDGEDNVLYALPYRSVVVSYDEFYEGTWVTLNRRVLSR